MRNKDQLRALRDKIIKGLEETYKLDLRKANNLATKAQRHACVPKHSGAQAQRNAFLELSRKQAKIFVS